MAQAIIKIQRLNSSKTLLTTNTKHLQNKQNNIDIRKKAVKKNKDEENKFKFFTKSHINSSKTNLTKLLQTVNFTSKNYSYVLIYKAYLL